MNKLYVIAALCLSAMQAGAQQTFPVNGVHNEKHINYAFTNAKIFVDYATSIDNATLVIKDGVVQAVGVGVAVPAGAVVYDLKGKSIYPAFIDAFSDYGMPEVRRGSGNGSPQMLSNTKGAYDWNQAIKPEFTANTIFNVDDKKADELRKLGFGAVNAVSKDGIARGLSSFVTLATENEHDVILKDKASANYSFDKGSSTQDYPDALMGAIALLRQTYLDAAWYKNNKNNPEYNISLDSWNKIQDVPQIFEVGDKLSALRADKIGDEFGVQYIIKGNGDEYQRIKEIKGTNASYILPLNYPMAIDVEDTYDAANVSLGEMKSWELAPSNLSAFEKNQVIFAITTSDLKDRSIFWKNLRKAIEYGLTEKAALKALTVTPAELLKVSDKVGTLKPGMLANFIITSKSVFDKENVIFENWIQGSQYKINDFDLADLRGTYTLTVGSLAPMRMQVSGEYGNPAVSITRDTVIYKVNFSRNGTQFSLQLESKDTKGTVRLSGYSDNANLKGKAQMPDGTWTNFTANYTVGFTPDAKKDTAKIKPLVLGKLTYPLKAYGWDSLPVSKTILIKNVTAWTNEQEGILQNTDVLIENGKIAKIGKSLAANGAQIIDGTGKHLTPGIIDEHSHIAIYHGVNEGTQAVTSEVRIGDVITSDDVDIYRQLSGGVTTSHLLHGSANPIGGQTALIKLRWGMAPEQMKFGGNDGFIKFALGENVKQSNWGDRNVIRFPQTRMGVEQVFIDAFTRAKEYEKNVKNNSNTRHDLELDALVEILNNKRFITCHSYVQSEINMLIHVSDSMGFKVNTFTHILEGYKVADKMKAHGNNASTFADWWAYKYEVLEAIPYNGAIMHDMGLNVAFNSDDAEMARRLNQEAAKAVKYGNVSEEEALKFVTLNPAKMLHIDNRVGSIKVGKDADVVLWTDNPLSIYAKSDKTFVDGIAYYDAERDAKMREEMRIEKARLVQKMAEAKTKGEKTQKPAKVYDVMYGCDGAKMPHETGK